eukprot:gene7202-5061_t
MEKQFFRCSAALIDNNVNSLRVELEPNVRKGIIKRRLVRYPGLKRTAQLPSISEGSAGDSMVGDCHYPFQIHARIKASESILEAPRQSLTIPSTYLSSSAWFSVESPGGPFFSGNCPSVSESLDLERLLLRGPSRAILEFYGLLYVQLFPLTLIRKENGVEGVISICLTSPVQNSSHRLCAASRCRHNPLEGGVVSDSWAVTAIDRVQLSI